MDRGRPDLGRLVFGRRILLLRPLGGRAGAGRDAFVRAVADPDSLADAPEVQRLVGCPRESWDDHWPAWEGPDYVALKAHGLLTGIHDNCGEAFYEAVTAQQNGESAGRGPVGGPANPLRPLALTRWGSGANRGAAAQSVQSEHTATAAA